MTETTTLEATIDTYLEAYLEPDADRRAQLIEQVWAPDGHLFDPPLDAAGPHRDQRDVRDRARHVRRAHVPPHERDRQPPRHRPLRLGARRRQTEPWPWRAWTSPSSGRTAGSRESPGSSETSLLATS